MRQLYAHTKKDNITKQVLPESEWQPLDEHLNAVAQKAAEFAAEFGAERLGYVAGLLHDIGKYSDAFQQRLHGSKKIADHKSEGARIAVERYGPAFGKLLAYAIYGHHNGLPDDTDLSEILMDSTGYNGSLLYSLPAVSNVFEKKLSQHTHKGMTISLLIRMLFSCLVDADFLDTERFIETEKYNSRGTFLTVDELYDRFKDEREKLLAHPQDTIIDKARHRILAACIKSAQEPPGLFKLTVPTGGGKTLSSLAFALEHAKLHNKKRIIYAIPFTSIIEQNAAVFRKIFGKDGVLEHHSNVINEPQDNKKEREDIFDISRLASENWQAGLIVTTNVQLFESLFAYKPSRTRKLHNLANAVIILDEAQTLPDHLLLPCLAVLQCLCEDYGATVLFCTATQPALKADWLCGCTPREIIDDPKVLYLELQRTTIHNLGKLDDEVLAEQLRQHEQALCIVNTRAEARRLYDLCQDVEHIFHLSALMCAEHRTKVLKKIKMRLDDKLPCLVVSTQLIEAGVDIDFPVVYRAIAGVDAIAQAAGRCNREGRLAKGSVYLFEFSSGMPSGMFSRLASFTQQVLQIHDNPLQLESVQEYFNLRYMFTEDLDKFNILKKLTTGASQNSFQFREIAADFQFISSVMLDIIIPYDEIARSVVEEARNSNYPASYARRLQRYSVSIYTDEFAELQSRGYIDVISNEIYVLSCSEKQLDEAYSSNCGLNVKPQMELLFSH